MTLALPAPALEAIHDQFAESMERVGADPDDLRDLRIGAELKFPVVDDQGEAVPRSTVEAVFEHLGTRGWRVRRDEQTGRATSARTPGEMNDTVAGVETGYCKAEFSMAHTADLHAMAEQVDQLREQVAPALEQEGAALIGCGIHPVTPPSAELKMNQQRAGVWGQVYCSNHEIEPREGDDCDLFTINAGSHVHVNVPRDLAATVTNVLNGFAPAQIALGANAGVWRGEVDPDHHCVSEAFWDWWKPAAGRVGMPAEPFENLQDYVRAIAEMPCLYVKRDGESVALPDQPPLAEFLAEDRIEGVTVDGETVTVTPEPSDVDLHNSCYWFNARVSRYFTVENRVFDQQPADALLAPAAVTLGLACAADEAWNLLSSIDWDELRRARQDAYRNGLDAEVDGAPVRSFAGAMLEIAQRGLRQRGLGEQVYLEPFVDRLAAGATPAEEAAAIFQRQGAAGLVDARRWA